MPIMRNTTVKRNANPQPIAIHRSINLSKVNFPIMLGKAKMTSEVTNSIIVTTASHKLKSEMVNGKNICPQSLRKLKVAATSNVLGDISSK